MTSPLRLDIATCDRETVQRTVLTTFFNARKQRDLFHPGRQWGKDLIYPMVVHPIVVNDFQSHYVVRGGCVLTLRPERGFSQAAGGRKSMSRGSVRDQWRPQTRPP